MSNTDIMTITRNGKTAHYDGAKGLVDFETYSKVKAYFHIPQPDSEGKGGWAITRVCQFMESLLEADLI